MDFAAFEERRDRTLAHVYHIVEEALGGQETANMEIVERMFPGRTRQAVRFLLEIYAPYATPSYNDELDMVLADVRATRHDVRNIPACISYGYFHSELHQARAVAEATRA